MNDLTTELAAAVAAVAEAEGDPSSDRILARIGQLTRTLRDSMRELGLDKQVEAAAQAVPDARDRLKYVATMTEQAAERALNAIELAKPMQEAMQTDAQALDARWAKWYDAPLAQGEAGALLAETRTFLQSVPERTQATNAQLLEIMLAQDFQDLTGQVIKKITDVVYLIEQQLLGVLLENIAPERREQFAASAAALMSSASGSPEGLLNGPQINPEGRSDVVQDQSQVDDLLASLGF
ncbi:protein phosphatase CheZ [Burkholderia sp. KK1]|uniref:Protein phosphatase CheZ n=1 Tax=Caballeronia cordobensis TaxID=1353886 RepID=A0A158EYF4_CABCO|nr:MULTISPECIES: protein phosphatase CheZ [Caballeronia]AET87963.1 chemotaxis phosphatase, CheZ [Burkholderia sp. YI23]AQG97516.1 protein phosphatase CheZ [Burkholderia sp. KK1]MCE4543104.1 protein phosphatase CheZ [Caballeronia sp. PC1]MCE4567841.1 protein phosphatase CheZ [Caballeronia sp. CLC5]SAL12568.1 chemotaxis regulator CheZ [Caballeronia cordobensis]